MGRVIRVELSEARKAKLAKRKKCDYCGEEKPKWIMSDAGQGGFMCNVARLPNGTFRCAMCAFAQASQKRT